MALVAYIVLSTWVGPVLNQNSPHVGISVKGLFTKQVAEATPQSGTNWTQAVGACGAVLLSLLFAPLLHLLRSPMWQYEEVLVYVYLFGIVLACGVISLARNPKWGRFWGLCALAGLGGLVRPTLVFYGLATVIVAGLVMACSLSQSQNRAQQGEIRDSHLMGLPISRLLSGVFLFALGGGLLFLTNRVQFGSGWEFGHKLNVNREPAGVVFYTTRFDDPFSRVPLKETARELFGALFQVRNFNHQDWYARGIFEGQSPTLRWRGFNLSTYDLSYAVCVGLAWIVGVWLMWRCLRPVTRTSPQSGRGGRGLPPVSALLILWSLLASLPLAAFYLRTPAIADRYMLDFSPAFVAALIGLWWWTVEWVSAWTRFSKWIHIVLLLALIGWQGSEIASGRSGFGPPVSRTWEELPEIVPLRNERDKSLPNEYRVGSTLGTWGIPQNGSGWDETSGQLLVSAIFFVENPNFLDIELSVAPGQHVREASVAYIRAKVGLEFLDRESIVRTNDGWIVRFGGPKQRRYQQGVQSVFLATVPPEELDKYVSTPTPWILKRLSWRVGQN
jgi:hypothetical protein